MADFSLKAVFGLDTTGVKTELKQLRKETNDFVSDWLKLSAAAGAGVFMALSKGAIDLAGRLSDSSQNIGINVEALQALEAQHKRNSVSEETLTKALEKLRLSTQEAATGNDKMRDSFAVLGLRAEDILRLPLEKKYEAVAKGVAQAQNQQAAYSAVAEIFGSKIGPGLQSSLKELADSGFDRVMKSAKEAGQVMSAETIVALDKAGDAIDDFKKQATIAVGNIIVNFRSEDGLKLLLFQFMKVVGTFGGGIVDAIVESGQMVWAVMKGAFVGVTNYLRDGLLGAVEAFAKQWNDLLPDFLKKRGFTINIAGIEALKSTGEGIADSITRAIAMTSPSTFKKDVADYWDKAIGDQQKVVDKLNKVDFGKQANDLRHAGDHMENAAKVGAGAVKESAQVLEAAGKFVAENVGNTTEANKKIIEGATQATAEYLKQFDSMPEDMRKAALDASTKFSDSSTSLWNIAVEAASKIAEAGRRFTDMYVSLTRVGTDYAQQSTAALQGVEQRLKKQYYDAVYDQSQYQTYANGERVNLGASVIATELQKVENELKQRSEVASYASKYGESAARFQYGDDVTQRALADLSKDTTQTALSVKQIAKTLANVFE